MCVEKREEMAQVAQFPQETVFRVFSSIFFFFFFFLAQTEAALLAMPLDEWAFEL